MAPIPGLPPESSRRPAGLPTTHAPSSAVFPQELPAGPGPPIQTGPLAPRRFAPFSEVEPPRIPALGKPTEVSPSPLLGWPRTPPTWDGGALPGPQYLWGLVPLQGTPPYQVLEFSGRHSVLSITSYPSFVSALLLPTDNVTVAAYINKQGGTRSTRLKSCGHGAGAGILSRSPSTAPAGQAYCGLPVPRRAFPPRSGPSTPRSWPLFSERSVPFTWICLRRHSMPSSRGTVRRLWIRQRGE